MSYRFILGTLALAVTACGSHQEAANRDPLEPTAPSTLTVTSPSFTSNAAIPADHTCEGADVAPPLAWTGAPAATKSFALVVDDPDAPDPNAPKKTWVHWLLLNIPGSTTVLPPGAGLSPPPGAINGNNDWSKPAWGGPCPPIGKHRYFFKVYALDAENLGKPGMTKTELLQAIAGHVLAKGELVGTYQKQGKS